MKLHCRFLILSVFTFVSIHASAQQNMLKFGLNGTHFNDWKRRPLNFFNPEFTYSRVITDKYSISNTVNAFWGRAKSVDMKKEDRVIDRLIFSNDITFDYFNKCFFLSAGPSIRYRNEKKIPSYDPRLEFFDFLIDPNKSHIDFGAAAKAGYNINITKKSIVVFNLAYRHYNKGVNPISFGVSYGWAWD